MRQFAPVRDEAAAVGAIGRAIGQSQRSQRLSSEPPIPSGRSPRPAISATFREADTCVGDRRPISNGASLATDMGMPGRPESPASLAKHPSGKVATGSGWKRAKQAIARIALSGTALSVSNPQSGGDRSRDPPAYSTLGFGVPTPEPLAEAAQRHRASPQDKGCSRSAGRSEPETTLIRSASVNRSASVLRKSGFGNRRQPTEKPRLTTMKEQTKQNYKRVLDELRIRFDELRQLVRIISSAGMQKFDLDVGTPVFHDTRGPGQIIAIDFKDARGKPYAVRFAGGEVHQYNAASAAKLKSLTKRGDLQFSKFTARKASLAHLSTDDDYVDIDASVVGRAACTQDASGQLAIHRAVVSVFPVLCAPVLKWTKQNVQRHQGTEAVTLLLAAGDSEQVVIQASWYPRHTARCFKLHVIPRGRTLPGCFHALRPLRCLEVSAALGGWSQPMLHRTIKGESHSTGLQCALSLLFCVDCICARSCPRWILRLSGACRQFGWVVQLTGSAKIAAQLLQVRGRSDAHRRVV